MTADHQMVLKEWNQTQTHFPEARCIHQQFETQVEQTPDAIAVVFENQQLTYRQLNERANQLAHYLRTLGVGSETLVGIYIERSLEMIVGLFGILKAGGAYVPLDPAHPSDRLAFILEDTQASVILTQAQLVKNLPIDQVKVICLDTDWEAIAQSSSQNPDCRPILSDLVYVIYTSGSTGQPKGVMVPHAGIHNQLYWRQTTFPLSETDRVLQNISFSFDPSVWQIFWTLSFGARLILPRPEGHRDSAYLVELIADQQITVIALVPSMLRVLLEEKGLDRCRCLRHVFCGGEALPLDLQQQFFARLNLDDVLHNVYGPTEASIDATFWTCQRDAEYPIAPIGRPIANAQIYILDEQLQPVPVGVPGELHIGGVGLARGYLNRPELTTEKFIANPYSSKLGDRLYKTGDLARYLPDGNIEFLGRIDYQVKVRGFRIELGEIESVLSQHSGIQQAVVVAREEVPGNQRLVAYIVAVPEHAPTVSELRSFLKAKLPDYMVPAAFVALERLPLNANGKVDRHALPAPDAQRLESEQPFVAPQDSLEQNLAQLWEQILNIHPIGIHDNFFELGGNSLLAVRLFAQIEETFNKRLPLSVFVQAPTIAQLAEILRQENWTAPWRSLVAIQPNGSKLPFFCIHSKGGNVLNYYLLARYLDHDQPFYGLQARGIEGNEPPRTQLEEMAAEYIKEIRSLQPSGPYCLGGYSFGGLVAFEMARQLQAQGEQVALLALLDTHSTPGSWFQRLRFRDRLSRYQRKLLQLPLTEKLAYLKEIGQLELAGKLTFIQKKLTRKGQNSKPNRAPVDASPQMMQGIRKTEAACERAAERYQPQVYSGLGQTVLFRAMKPPEWAQPLKAAPDLGWANLITGGVAIEPLDCHHFNLLNEPQVNLLAQKLQLHLDAAQATPARVPAASAETAAPC